MVRRNEVTSEQDRGPSSGGHPIVGSRVRRGACSVCSMEDGEDGTGIDELYTTTPPRNIATQIQSLRTRPPLRPGPPE
jgi:hypothetical protein